MIGLLCLLLAVYCYPGRRRPISIWLLFFLATAGFQLVPVNWIVLPNAGITKCYDWVLVFAVIMLFLRAKLFVQTAIWRHFRLFLVFALLLAVLFCYSILFRDIEVSVAVRVFRNFIIFIVLFLFIPLTEAGFRQVFRWIVYATSAASLVYCLQLPLHHSLLNRVTSDMTPGEMVTRYYNVPVFVYPVVFFLFYPFPAFSIRWRKVLLCINLLAILLTQHRNVMLAVAACFMIYLLLQNRMRLRSALLYCSLGIPAFITADALMEKRFSKGYENVSALSLNTSGIKYSQIALSDLSTTRFRQLILAERFQYVMADETRTVLGIGLMTDDSRKAKPLQFYIGMPDDEGNISQIANVDIAWASLLLQLGLPGTVLYILLQCSLMRRFFRYRGDSYMQVGFLFLVSLLITSFYGSTIVMPYITCLVMLFAAYYYCLAQTPGVEQKNTA